MTPPTRQQPMAVLLLGRLLDALKRQTQANDGEWETDEVGRLRAEAEDYLVTLTKEPKL